MGTSAREAAGGAGGHRASRLEVIPYDECIDLLAANEVGRLGVIADGEPLIEPVNYPWDGSAVVLRTDPGRKLSAAVGQVVVFEIDRLDRVNEEGWSVLVRGRCQLVDPGVAGRPGTAAPVGDDAGRSCDDSRAGHPVEHASRAGPRPWAPGPKEHWLRVVAHSVSGRRIRRDDGLADQWWRLAASS
jgi:hypothetical protein